MSETELPFFARQVHNDVLACRGNDRLAVILVGEGVSRGWTMAERDMGGRFNALPRAKRHAYSAGVELFDRGLVRIVDRRLIPVLT